MMNIRQTESLTLPVIFFYWLVARDTASTAYIRLLFNRVIAKVFLLHQDLL